MSRPGVWLPIVTPFNNNEIDYDSYKNLIDHYIDNGITGIMTNCTTGECPVLSDYEQDKLLETTLEYVNHRVPLYWGAGGNNTAKVCSTIEQLSEKGIDGFLSVSPYYNRPSQDGIYEHFKMISQSASLPILIYNIPYRTGMNMTNETILKVAELVNIVGIKDSSGDINQTAELIREAPEGFNVFTGDDVMFYINLVLGGAGGIMASAHLDTKIYLEIFNMIKINDHKSAAKLWEHLSKKIPYLFKETNPGPIKYLLKDKGLIKSDELRLPLKGVTEDYKQKLKSL